MPTTTITPIDVNSIKSTAQPWADACLARNWDALLALCTDDVVFLPPDEPQVQGEHLRPWLEHYPEIRSFEVEFEQVEGQDQIATARGRFTMTLLPPGQADPVTTKGKFVDIFRKDLEGTWRYATVIWNSALPTPIRGVSPAAASSPLQALGLAPSLTVDDLPRSIELFEGLGFVVTDRWEESGKLMGVMVGAGSAQIGLAQDDGQKGRGRTKGVGTRLWLETNQDIDELADRARMAGVTLSREPYDTPWRSRAVDVITPEGFALTISTPMT